MLQLCLDSLTTDCILLLWYAYFISVILNLVQFDYLRCFCFYFTESYVYEDPAVVYEGVVADPDPIDLDSYLVSSRIFLS